MKSSVLALEKNTENTSLYGNVFCKTISKKKRKKKVISILIIIIIQIFKWTDSAFFCHVYKLLQRWVDDHIKHDHI